MSLAVQSGHTVLGQFESHKTQPLPPSSGNQLPQIQHSSLLLICDREPFIYLLVRRTCTTQYRDGHRECEWLNAQWLVHASTVGGLELFASYSRYRFSVGSGVTLLEPTVCSFAIIMRLGLRCRLAQGLGLLARTCRIGPSGGSMTWNGSGRGFSLSLFFLRFIFI